MSFSCLKRKLPVLQQSQGDPRLKEWLFKRIEHIDNKMIGKY